MSKAGERLIAGVTEIRNRVLAMKPADQRPRKGGWAPGGYMAHCRSCDRDFIGDKRAIFCADCAYASD